MAGRSDNATGLFERLAEVIEEFSLENKITLDDILWSLEHTHACIERYSDDKPASKLN